MSTAQKPSDSTAQIIQFERLLDSDEAAFLLKIHPKTLQKLARKGEIAGVQIGKLWRFRASTQRVARTQDRRLIWNCNIFGAVCRAASTA